MSSNIVVATNHRQSRLIQPSAGSNSNSRLSFGLSSSSRLAPNTTSSLTPTTQNTFQQFAKTTDGVNSSSIKQAVKMEQSNLSNSYSQHLTFTDSQVSSNAIVSGLPAPKQRLTSASHSICEPATVAGASTTRLQQPTVGITPSTVGSALRRRQPSSATPSVGQLRAPNSILSNNSCSQNDSSSFVSQTKFGIRRSQSQHPGPVRMFAEGNGGIFTANTQSSYNRKPMNQFTVNLRTSPTSKQQARSKSSSVSAPKSEANDDEDDDEPDATEAAKSVQSLPPLKSTTYISRLISGGEEKTDQSQQETLSEPIVVSSATVCNGSSQSAKSSSVEISKNMDNNLVGVTPKPSQLVKPLVNKSQLRRASTTSTASANKSSQITSSNHVVSANQAQSEQQASKNEVFKRNPSALAIKASGTSLNRTSSFKQVGRYKTHTQLTLLPTLSNTTSTSTSANTNTETIGSSLLAERNNLEEKGRRFSLQQKCQTTVCSYNNSLNLLMSIQNDGCEPALVRSSRDSGSSEEEGSSSLEDEDEGEETENDEEIDDDDGVDNAKEGEEEEDDVEEEEEEDGDDEDATTATTMTQISDTNGELSVSSSNHKELNNMMQMLSSSAILADSNQCENSIMSVHENNKNNRIKTPKVGGYGRKSSIPSSASSTTLMFDKSSNLASHLPRVKNKLLKSQSSSFNNQFSKLSIQTSSGFKFGNNDAQVEQSLNSSSSDHYQRPGNMTSSYHQRDTEAHQQQSVGLPRPRSRIIFDPTSSRFHVSCCSQEEAPTLVAGDNSGVSRYNFSCDRDTNTDTGNSEKKLMANPLSEYNNQSLSANSEHTNVTSTKRFLDTQCQMSAFKYLPSTNCDGNTMSGAEIRRNESATAHQNNHSSSWALDLTTNKSVTSRYKATALDSEDGVIRRLSDCRGSLESLIMSRGLRSSEPPEEHVRSRTMQLNTEHTPIERPSTNRRSPVGSTLRSIFGLRPSLSGESQARGVPADVDSGSSSRPIVRHASLRQDPRQARGGLVSGPGELQPIERKTSLQSSGTMSASEASQDQVASSSPKNSLGSELLQRASKKLSASSSSLTNKFKFISSSTNLKAQSQVQDQAQAQVRDTSSQQQSSTDGTPTGAAAASSNIKRSLPMGNAVSASGIGGFNGRQIANNSHNSKQFALVGAISKSSISDKNAGLPPRKPSSELKQASLNGSYVKPTVTPNGIGASEYKAFSDVDKNSLCDDVPDYSTAIGSDNDADTTILSDTSTLHGDSNNMAYVNKCAELERTVESLKNKLISKEKEMTELQLKQWSSDYSIEQLKLANSRLEKENAQLKALVAGLNRVNI